MLKVLILVAALSAGTAANADTILNDPSGSAILQVNAFEPIGQSFKAVDAQLLSIGFRFGEMNPGNPNDPIQLDLYAGDGVSGTLIASRTIVLPAGQDYSFFTDFDFTGTALTVGATYSAALSIVGDSALIGIDADLKNNYADGSLFSPGAAFVGCQNSACDLKFRIVGSGGGGGGAAVPEPTTWAMMIGGFGMLGAAARRRTRTAITYA